MVPIITKRQSIAHQKQNDLNYCLALVTSLLKCNGMQQVWNRSAAFVTLPFFNLTFCCCDVSHRRIMFNQTFTFWKCHSPILVTNIGELLFLFVSKLKANIAKYSVSANRIFNPFESLYPSKLKRSLVFSDSRFWKFNCLHFVRREWLLCIDAPIRSNALAAINQWTVVFVCVLFLPPIRMYCCVDTQQPMYSTM